MPRYLRWSAAATTGIICQFVFQFLALAIVHVSGHNSLHGGIAALIVFGAEVVVVVASLAVNDWLASRYPVESKPAPESVVEDATSSVSAKRQGSVKLGTQSTSPTANHPAS